MAVWRTIQTRILEATGLRLGLWDDESTRVLPEPLLPPACQYIQSDPSRRERCEQFHRSVRSDVRRNRRASCATCPFGIQYMAVPVCGDGQFAGHWEGGFVVEPGPLSTPDPSVDPKIWFGALAGTPHRTETEVRGALELLQLLHGQAVSTLALRERRRSQVTQLLASELSRTLDNSHSLEETLKRFVYLATQVVGVPIGVLLLREPATGDLVASASEGLGPEHAPFTRLPAGRGVAGRVVEQGRSIRIDDLAYDPHFRAFPPPLDKVRSLLAVPVRQHGEVLGVLELMSYSPHAFTTDDNGLLQAFAELAGGLLNQDLVRHLPSRVLDGLSGSLRAVTASAEETAPPDRLLGQILDLIMQVMRASSCALLLVDRSELRLRCARGNGRPNPDVRLRVGEGVTGWVAQTGEPLYVPNVEADPRYLNARTDLRSELAVPLVADGEVIGVLDVGSIHHHFFAPNEVQMLTILATLAVLALQMERIAQA